MEKTDLLGQLRIDRGQEETSSSRGLWVGLIIAVLVIVAGAGGWWLTRGTVAAVQVASAVTLGSTPASASVLDASGYVTARRQATVSSKITGKVREVMIEEGQTVTAGEVLATLDDTEARANLSLTQAQLESARAQLGETRTQLANAEREYTRQQGLADRKLVSVQALDSAKTQVDALRARLNASQRAAVVAEESLKVAQVSVDNTIVRAPFDGVVTVKAAQPGEMISPISAGGGFTRTGIGTIVDMNSLEIQVDVSESFINRVKPGQPVEATLNSYPDWKIPAEVIAVIPTADRTKATVKVRIGFKQRDARILPDMGIRVAFLEDKPAANAPVAAKPIGVLVPQAAVRDDAGKAYVLVMSEDRAERRVVELGETRGDSRVIVAGVRGGERVIVSGPEGLKAGDKVRLADSE